MRHPLLAALFSLTLVPAVEAAPSTVPLGGSPTLGGGEYTSGGGITVAVEPRRTTEGRIAICGVWAQSEQLTAYVRQSGKSMLDKGSLVVNGQLAQQGLGFLNRVPAAQSYAQAEASCVSTNLAWQEGAAIDVRIPRHVVAQERNGSGGGGIEIRFIPSEDANPALRAGSLFPAWLTSKKGTLTGKYGGTRLTQ